MVERPAFLDFCHSRLPETVSGFEGIRGALNLCPPGERTVLDLTMVIGALPNRKGREALTEALFRVVEAMAIDGVMPEIIRGRRRLDSGEELFPPR